MLETLSKAEFLFNVTKSSILKIKIEYLGSQVSNGQIRAIPRKIQALAELPPPKTVTQLRKIIEIASYFRQFVPKFSEILKPLYQPHRKKTPISFGC